MSEQLEYNALVKKRRACNTCMAIRAGKGGMHYRNQASFPGIFDADQIGNYSTWAHDLNAQVMIVGQDYCDAATYVRDEGRIQKKPIEDLEDAKEYSTETNYRLRLLVKELGLDLGSPYLGSSTSGVFLSNAILCMKPGGMSDPNPQKVYNNCGANFLRPLIDLVRPRAIITLGVQATRSVLFTYLKSHPEFKALRAQGFKEVFQRRAIELEKDRTLFPVYHPGSLGRMNRKKIEPYGPDGWSLQVEDWRRIKQMVAKGKKSGGEKGARYGVG